MAAATIDNTMKISYQDTAHIKPRDLERSRKTLSTYFKKLNSVYKSKSLNVHESSINLLQDQSLQKQIINLVKEKGGRKLKYIIVVGIGGSNLGAKAMYDAHYGFFDILEPKRFPKIIFADTTHPEFMAKLQILIKNEIKTKEEILINAISKSGNTTETLANIEILWQLLSRFTKTPAERLVITTDFESKFWQLAKDKNISTLTIPNMVGGRFSVFSAVGLFPLALAGIDTMEFTAGAHDMLKRCLSEELTNPALISAVAMVKNYTNNKNIFDSFFFNPELESLGKWYRQLLGESLGKEESLLHDRVAIGLSPTVSIGSTDLHSVGQLYLGGPKDKFTTFIFAEKTKNEIKTPNKLSFPLVQGIDGIELQKIRSAILDGVKSAYRKKNLPFLSLTFPDLSERSIGGFMQFKLMEIMFLGQLLKVNAFDQPNVELYKQETKRLLNN